jgi:hypothetical protein
MTDMTGPIPEAPIPAPLFQQITCVAATCPRCRAEPKDDDDGGIPHFTSTSEAHDDLAEHYGWRVVVIDGAEFFVCRQCAETADCDRLGHVPVDIPPATLDDGSVIGATTWCDCCGTILAHTPRTPAPAGYPAPAHRRLDLYWDAAALPGGQDLADAASRLIARLSDTAVAARWDAWQGDQSHRPAPRAPADPAGDAAAAALLIAAAERLLGRQPAHASPLPAGHTGTAATTGDQF